jgi:hypothetical protein
MDNTLVLKQDPILLHVVGPMMETDTIAEEEDDTKVAVEAVTDAMMIDDLIGVVVVVNDIAIGGVVIETKNNRKYKV